MKKILSADCDTVMDTLYLSDKDSFFPSLNVLLARFHLLFCPDCAREFNKLKNLEEIMKTDFFPFSPDLEGSIMHSLNGNASNEENIAENMDAPAGFSLRGWVITGFFLLLSLSSSFFGIVFNEIASTAGLSFVLPVSITVGMVLTCYGAFFIGSHLNELSSRFRFR